jgi:hypothetical protein
MLQLISTRPFLIFPPRILTGGQPLLRDKEIEIKEIREEIERRRDKKLLFTTWNNPKIGLYVKFLQALYLVAGELKVFGGSVGYAGLIYDLSEILKIV